MPDDPHAVSACLPLWRHNVAYEEGDADVVDRLQAAYPRFCFHPLITKLCQRYFPDSCSPGLPFVSLAAGQRAAEYVRHRGGETRDVTFHPSGWCGVAVPARDFQLLKQYWQHAGEILSSRAAYRILNGLDVGYTQTEARLDVIRQVSELHDEKPSSTFLFPSGMAAIAAAWRIAGRWRAGATCQFGFPYVDTLKIQQRFPSASHHFFPVGSEDDLESLRALCANSPPVAVFCEIPTNPLLDCPDLQALRQLADEYRMLLVVDDTLGACLNLDVGPYADLVVTSLTKYFSGHGNVLAGSLVVPSGQPHSDLLREYASADFEENLADCDVAVLAQNSRDLKSRVLTINNNAARLASELRRHDSVASVFYPTASSPNYELVRRNGGGYGGLLSIVLMDPSSTTAAFYDRLRVCKGPNLGTYFSLCCPYTILAHYDELEFAEESGVSQWLVRISVGTEPFEDLLNRFVLALAPDS